MKQTVRGFNTLTTYCSHLLKIDEQAGVLRWQNVYEFQDKIIKCKSESDTEGKKIVYLN